MRSPGRLARILVEPEASLIKQYMALLATEGVTLEFTDDAITESPSWRPRSTAGREHRRAPTATIWNGGRRDQLHRLGPARRGVVVDPDYVRAKVSHLVEGADLSRFIL